ncbi:hypothetical protein FNV43_RR03235 [Rhamnella rubrinervis]|uniref:Cotton fiber protein n=1 Tax=Rhamnella rubrinervis TaxID=2594499 RepID=A0A8K0HHL8_9ROSA|nr:hypothetical protein FNV43_RR03235 [Rhamnella rubrinervis]
MGFDSRSLISRLRMAVNKVKFLMNFNVNSWRVASMVRRSSLPKRILSFNDRPGLRACTEDTDDNYSDRDDDDQVSRSNSSNGLSLQRTISFPSDQGYDIDQRAEMFISNFRRQLQMERQISLELGYCRTDSFEGKSP